MTVSQKKAFEKNCEGSRDVSRGLDAHKRVYWNSFFGFAVLDWPEIFSPCRKKIIVRSIGWIGKSQTSRTKSTLAEKAPP